MGDDATLSAFIETDGDQQTEGASADEDAANGQTATDGEQTPVRQAETTYAFDPEGAVCDACQETVTRRWGQEGSLVCPSCKDW